MTLAKQSIQASCALHFIAVAAVAAWTALSATIPPRHAGISHVVELVVTQAEPTWSDHSLTFDETAFIEPPVTVQPMAVTIAQKHFALATSNSLVPESIPLELPDDLKLTKLLVTERSKQFSPLTNKPELRNSEVRFPRRQARPPKLQPALAQAPQEFGTDETAPRFTSSPPPNYPSIAIASGWEGTSLLRVRIDETGTVTNVEVARSSGHAVLDGAAVNAVQRWHGSPATRFGKAVETTELLPVRFRL